MIKQYLVFDFQDGQYKTSSNFEGAKTIKKAIIQRKVDELQATIAIQCEGTNSNGDSVILSADKDGNAFIPDFPVQTIEEVEAQQETPFTDLERAAWVEYLDALQNIKNQPGYPFDVTYPVPPNTENR
jgi:hypothetical protein